ncbi:unnamed protein product [Prunus armeniaca]|uniref:Uncharacterized protein n=1 Tax=Prunus armeniaca TaxID=36596 RepID=A0A6J5WE07_PRUAR|nr:unnamed protein product [Prunus armeniaca]
MNNQTKEGIIKTWLPSSKVAMPNMPGSNPDEINVKDARKTASEFDLALLKVERREVKCQKWLRNEELVELLNLEMRNLQLERALPLLLLSSENNLVVSKVKAREILSLWILRQVERPRKVLQTKLAINRGAGLDVLEHKSRCSPIHNRLLLSQT